MSAQILSHPIHKRNGYAKHGEGFRSESFGCGDFRCLVCHNPVSGLSLVSGVQHRNHCPYCLWSRCLDLYAPGDRLSACKAGMRPVGLALKRTNKKYGSEKSGELMLVHACSECGKVSLNRLAADDDAQTVLEIFDASLALEASIRARLAENGILTLQRSDFHILRTRLFGKN
jgi:RNHCP domain